MEREGHPHGDTAKSSFEPSKKVDPFPGVANPQFREFLVNAEGAVVWRDGHILLKDSLTALAQIIYADEISEGEGSNERLANRLRKMNGDLIALDKLDLIQRSYVHIPGVTSKARSIKEKDVPVLASYLYAKETIRRKNNLVNESVKSSAIYYELGELWGEHPLGQHFRNMLFGLDSQNVSDVGEVTGSDTDSIERNNEHKRYQALQMRLENIPPPSQELKKFGVAEMLRARKDIYEAFSLSTKESYEISLRRINLPEDVIRAASFIRHVIEGNFEHFKLKDQTIMPSQVRQDLMKVIQLCRQFEAIAQNNNMPDMPEKFTMYEVLKISTSRVKRELEERYKPSTNLR